MTALGEIVKALKEISEGPWVHQNGEIIARGMVVAQVMGGDDFPCCDENIDEECKANTYFIASSPRLLAELVVRVVEERASMLEIRCELDTGTSSGVDRYLNEALSDPDINITPKDFAWLKGKVGG